MPGNTTAKEFGSEDVNFPFFVQGDRHLEGKVWAALFNLGDIC